jgi:hypothetical protein
MIIEKKFGFEPIRLKKNVSTDRIRALKDEARAFSGYFSYYRKKQREDEALRLVGLKEE